MDRSSCSIARTSSATSRSLSSSIPSPSSSATADNTGARSLPLFAPVPLTRGEGEPVFCFFDGGGGECDISLLASGAGGCAFCEDGCDDGSRRKMSPLETLISPSRTSILQSDIHAQIKPNITKRTFTLIRRRTLRQHIIRTRKITYNARKRTSFLGRFCAEGPGSSAALRLTGGFGGIMVIMLLDPGWVEWSRPGAGDGRRRRRAREVGGRGQQARCG